MMKKQDNFYSIVGIDRLGKTTFFSHLYVSLLSQIADYVIKNFPTQIISLKADQALPRSWAYDLYTDDKEPLEDSYKRFAPCVKGHYQMLKQVANFKHTLGEDSHLLTDRSIICTAAYSLGNWEKALEDAELPSKVVYFKYTGAFEDYRNYLQKYSKLDELETRYLEHYEQVQANYDKILEKYYTKEDVFVIERPDIQGIFSEDVDAACMRWLMPEIHTEEGTDE